MGTSLSASTTFAWLRLKLAVACSLGNAMAAVTTLAELFNSVALACNLGNVMAASTRADTFSAAEDRSLGSLMLAVSVRDAMPVYLSAECKSGWRGEAHGLHRHHVIDGNGRAADDEVGPAARDTYRAIHIDGAV